GNDEPRGAMRQTKGAYVSPRRLHCFVGHQFRRYPSKLSLLLCPRACHSALQPRPDERCEMNRTPVGYRLLPDPALFTNGGCRRRVLSDQHFCQIVCILAKGSPCLRLLQRLRFPPRLIRLTIAVVVIALIRLPLLFGRILHATPKHPPPFVPNDRVKGPRVSRVAPSTHS